MYVCNDIGEALARGKKWSSPLLFFVTSPHTAPSTNEGSLSCDDIPEFYASHRVRGEKVINPKFCFSSEAIQHNGYLQCRALEVVLKGLRFHNVVVVHLIEVGAHAHELFVAAVPDAKDIVPRLHVFPPKVGSRPNIVLHGPGFTPAHLNDVLRSHFGWAPPQNSPEMLDAFFHLVKGMDAESRRLLPLQLQDAGAQQFNASASTSATTPTPASHSDSAMRLHGAAPPPMGTKRAAGKGGTEATRGESDEAPQSKRAVMECCSGEGCRIKHCNNDSKEQPDAGAVGGVPKEGPTVHCPGGASALNEKEDTSTSVHASRPTVSSGVDLRCSLPDGNTHTVHGLDVSTATLTADVRAHVEALLGHNDFVFARPHPPHRFTTEEEALPLEAIGMRGSSAVRVILVGNSLGSAGSAGRSRSGASNVLGLLSSWLGRSRDSAQPSTSSTPSTASATATARGGSGASGSRLRTMADVLAENEAEEIRRALRDGEMEGQRAGRANRYFGGTSTEYVGRGDGGEGEDDEERKRR